MHSKLELAGNTESEDEGYQSAEENQAYHPGQALYKTIKQ